MGRVVEYLVRWDTDHASWAIERDCGPSYGHSKNKSMVVAKAIAAAKEDTKHADKVFVQSRERGKFKKEWESP